MRPFLWLALSYAAILTMRFIPNFTALRYPISIPEKTKDSRFKRKSLLYLVALAGLEPATKRL